MIEIKPDSDFGKMAEYTGTGGEGTVYMSAKDGDELLGAMAMSAEGEILCIKTDLDFLIDGIIKSAINFFDRRDIKNVTCKSEKLAPFLKKIGFKPEEGVWVINTDVFFGKDNCVK